MNVWTIVVLLTTLSVTGRCEELESTEGLPAEPACGKSTENVVNEFRETGVDDIMEISPIESDRENQLESSSDSEHESLVLDANITTTSNLTEPRGNKTELMAHKPRLNCLQNATASGPELNQVILLNGTELTARLGAEHNSNVTNRTIPSTCSITLFFASWCEFSANAAPLYNSLARFYPHLNFYAVESGANTALNTQYGVIAVPTLIVFHNSKPLYRYNNTGYSLEKFQEFITTMTGMEPLKESLELRPEDYEGPVPTEAVPTENYLLILSSLFLLGCALFDISKSSQFRSILDMMRNAWREVEIQHEHQD